MHARFISLVEAFIPRPVFRPREKICVKLNWPVRCTTTDTEIRKIVLLSTTICITAIVASDLKLINFISRSWMLFTSCNSLNLDLKVLKPTAAVDVIYYTKMYAWTNMALK